MTTPNDCPRTANIGWQDGRMRMTASHLYFADPTVVHSMLIDPAFLRHAAISMGANSASVIDGGLIAVLPAPDEIVGFVGPTLTLQQRIFWRVAEPDGTRHGTLELTFQDAPVRVSGDTLLAPDAAGTRVDYDGDLRVDIPLLGRTIERKAAPLIHEALDAQFRLGQAWLTR